MGDIPPEAEAIGQLAYREAQEEGCDCDPAVVINPTALPPFWRAVVEHDEWCRLIRRLRDAGATDAHGTPL